MFGISGSEAAFWLLLALVVVGPTNLPRAARTVRDAVSAFRQALDRVRSGVDRQVSESLRASGLADLGPGGDLERYLTGETGGGDEFVPTPPPPPPAAEAGGDTPPAT